MRMTRLYVGLPTLKRVARVVVTPRHLIVVRRSQRASMRLPLLVMPRGTERESRKN